jgi:uncharacterized repeat protein (TIGR03899 family)
MSESISPFIDLKALSEPVCKLIEAVQSAAGVVYEPTQIRRKAKADADALIIKLKGEIEHQEIALRAAERINKRDVRRQQNIEKIVANAVQQLPETVSKEKVDEDWTTQFFEYCQDVSNEEMQSLWAKLLAGEVALPGSYSLRTLHTVKLMRKKDADLFTKFCSYVWGDEEHKALVHLHTAATNGLLFSRGLSFEEKLHLQTIGLIQMEGSITIPENEPVTTTYFSKKYNLTLKSDSFKAKLNRFNGARVVPYFKVDADFLTETGKELALICGANADEDYLNSFIESLSNEYISATLLDD